MDRSGWDFFRELARYGPPSHGQPTRPDTTQRSPDLTESENYCRWVATVHYENFQIASWLLPRQLRQDFFNIYAYCRWSDDFADETGPKPSQPATSRDSTLLGSDPGTRDFQTLELLAWWQSELDKLFRQPNDPRPVPRDAVRHPVMIALEKTLEKHRLPKHPFDDLISAFVQDQTVKRYETVAELDDYCRRSANPVGRLILGLGHVAEDQENLRLSDAICSGLQLANFCQDMARDAAMDRIYAPRELYAQHGVDQAMILAGRSTPPLQSMLAQWVAMARDRLDMGAPLAGRLPRWLATDVGLFRAGGLAILEAIERQNYDVWTRRPTISKMQKAKLLLMALTKRFSLKPASKGQSSARPFAPRPLTQEKE